LYLHMEASQHSLLAACFTLHSINATLAIVPQRGAGLWIAISSYHNFKILANCQWSLSHLTSLRVPHNVNTDYNTLRSKMLSVPS
jgi:hypothetical protein